MFPLDAKPRVSGRKILKISVWSIFSIFISLRFYGPLSTSTLTQFSLKLVEYIILAILENQLLACAAILSLSDQTRSFCIIPTKQRFLFCRIISVFYISLMMDFTISFLFLLLRVFFLFCYNWFQCICSAKLKESVSLFICPLRNHIRLSSFLFGTDYISFSKH